MALAESVVAEIFYVSVAALVYGSIACARVAVERSRPVPSARVALVIGAIGLIVAVASFVTGSRETLPF